MIIRQIYTSCLAQASYFIASAGIAALIDPMRDVQPYIDLAASKKAIIRYVLVTNFHADFISGQLELARKTGATIVFCEPAQPAYPALIAADGYLLPVGDCMLRVLHTPGHTIESACFLLLDETEKPHALFTGDTLFIGDAGRPDLLSGNLDAATLAALLYDSIQDKILPLPDDMLVYPGHGAGSACGKNLGKETCSTLGEQKRHNPAFKLSKNDFIAEITSGQPQAPAYFFKDARINREGCRDLSDVLQKSLKPIDAILFRDTKDFGVPVLDTRAVSGSNLRMIEDAIHIGLGGQFAVWAGTLIDFEKPLLLVNDPGTETEVITRLSRVGFDRCIGFLDGSMEAWNALHAPVTAIPFTQADELSQADISRNPAQLLDVRRQTEFEQEHLEEAIHIPLEELENSLEELDNTLAYTVICAGGYRSLIAASILKKAGFEKVSSVTGGMAAVRNAFPERIVSTQPVA